MKKNLLSFGVGLLFLAIFASSCGNTRQITYMQGSFDTATLSQINLKEPVIQRGDLMGITIYSDNPQATAIYNLSASSSPSISAGSSSTGSGSESGASGGSTPGGSTSSGTASTAGASYLVDDSGYIRMYGIGKVHVQNLTKAQLKDTLDSKLDSKFGGPLNNPFYTIRFLNYRVTLLGEVSHPGIFSIPGEHLSLLEAIGMAGDLTFYGRRDNVLVIRQNDGKREFARLDLTKPEIMGSPYFYLQQDDMVIVEANKKKIVANDQVTIRNVSIAATIVSTIAIVYSIFK